MPELIQSASQLVLNDVVISVWLYQLAAIRKRIAKLSESQGEILCVN